MGNFTHQIQIVTDQQQCHAQFLLQFAQQFEDFQLHGDVKRGGGLVGNQQFRFVSQRHGDHYPLALATGQLVRVGTEAFAWLGDAHQIQ